MTVSMASLEKASEYLCVFNGRSELWGGRHLDGLHRGRGRCVGLHDRKPKPLDRHSTTDQN